MELLKMLSQVGLEFKVEGDQLHVKSMEDLPTEFLEWLSENKQQLLSELGFKSDLSDQSIVQLFQASDLGLDLLPGNPGDEAYVNDILKGRSSEQRHIILSGYKQQWSSASNAPGVKEIEAQEFGRRAANTWIRTTMH